MVNAAFKALTDEQQALCIATATWISATSTTKATIQLSPGPTQTVFVVNATAYAADVHCQPMPIAIVQCLPHMQLSLGPSFETANFPNIYIAIDMRSGIVTSYYSYLMSLAKSYPHCLYRLLRNCCKTSCSSKKHTKNWYSGSSEKPIGAKYMPSNEPISYWPECSSFYKA
jgi:hypothetical protein